MGYQHFKEIEGLGDLIAYVLHNGPTGKLVHWITGKDKPCDNCEERRKKFNEAVRFRRKQNENS